MKVPSLRLVLAVSLDGRLAPPEGGAAQLGGSGDRRVLEEALAWADGCLIGAETLRRHGSTCLIHAPDLLAQRLASGRGNQPVAVVVSSTARLSADLPFWQQPLERWLLAPAGTLPQQGFQRQLDHAGWPGALAALQAAGLERLVVLGGANLAAGLLAGGWIDALQLTLCPRLLGGPHSWVPLQAAVQGGAWQLEELRRLPADELLVRYRRVLAKP
ncbi:dihydrofolate reductase family protein [Cyanobium sp. FACHB-13342]|uniref:RibD family protein n=1 Tax=Cyanobium sp. FACHB-13342 TaxID=2692793 RepID=UPI0016804A46|nr:dihydrofolate reductase family protein [Cyanobium sp. FACHB-13342]MBD2423646.1 dihydrofolate reductase family protein [Cyanobium sp. FACHB-13342]